MQNPDYNTVWTNFRGHTISRSNPGIDLLEVKITNSGKDPRGVTQKVH